MLSDWTSFGEYWTNDWEALYRVVSNNKQVTDALHAKFARCRCSEQHATFSEVNWHQTESYTRKFATFLSRTVIAFRITGQS